MKGKKFNFMDLLAVAGQLTSVQSLVYLMWQHLRTSLGFLLPQPIPYGCEQLTERVFSHHSLHSPHSPITQLLTARAFYGIRRINICINSSDFSDLQVISCTWDTTQCCRFRLGCSNGAWSVDCTDHRWHGNCVDSSELHAAGNQYHTTWSTTMKNMA